MTGHDHIFLSYSRNDLEAAVNLHSQLERAGLTVFRDEKNIGWSESWLNEIQDKVRTCFGFVLLVGHDGVQRWVGAETEVALIRHINPHDSEQRLPIFPILLDGASHEALPAFLWSCQGIFWDGRAMLDPHHLDRIRARDDLAKDRRLPPDVCPFVGLDSFGPDQARLFFGRQEETLKVLACFDRRPGHAAVRWVEINGNSGSGKSSLMNAGILPLIDKGWLWRRTGYGTWRRIGPMMPGAKPVGTLAGALAIAFGWEKADVRRYIEAEDDRALADWLCSRKPRDNPDDTAFLLAIDQFEELFTFADPDERRRFDRLLAAALLDHDCPLFVLSTVRSDFLDRFQNDLPRLVAVRNGPAKLWTLPLISGEALREVITGPARLAGLNVDEVVEAMLDDAEGEPGALPLVEYALAWLWQQPRNGNRLSGEQFHRQGKLGGILSNSADDLLDSLQPDERERALDLFLAMVRPDEDNRRHTRRSIAFINAVRIAGGDDRGHALIDRLQGRRILQGGRAEGPLRLITVTPNDADSESGGWVNLIHETLICCKAGRNSGGPQPFWPTLWKHIENNRGQVLRRDHVLARAPIIEADAIAWDRAGRDDSMRWEEKEVLRVLGEIREGGLSPHDVIRPGLSRAFFGPTDPPEIVEMLALTEADDGTCGSDRYGMLWQLPLGHQRRAVLAERLAIVGDPRRGVGLGADGLPEIDWVPIAGGTVEIEGRTMTVAPFAMARYPVTIAQFRAFVAECFRDGVWQLPPGFTGRPPEKSPPEHKERAANHGADSVSWDDAQAFCHWLSARLGMNVRLPTKAEWQLAATGGDLARIWPWGPDWDPEKETWRANTAESGLRRTLPAGFYPLGASPAGVMDMAGNLWEWCLDAFGAARRGPSDPHPPRVVRGGSWLNDQGLARSVSLNGFDSHFRYSNVGFRVVYSSASSRH